MKSSVSWCAAVVAAAGAAMATAQSAGQDGGASGRVLREWRATAVLRSDYFHSSRGLDDETDLFGVTAQFKVLPHFAANFDGKVEARVTRPSLEHGSGLKHRVLEAYLEMRLPRADLRLGRQIVAWGRADGLNPTDNLTPRDYTVLLPFEDDQRFGTTAARLDTYLFEEFTFTVFATPFFEPSRVPMPASAGVIERQVPTRSLDNTEVGLKLDQTGAGIDWSMSYFRGFSPLPTLRLSGPAGAGRRMGLHYDRIDVLGADVARNLGRFGFRGEIAYVNTRDDTGDDFGIKNPQLYVVVGVDRTYFANLNVNLQFFHRMVRNFHHPDGITDEQERGIAWQNNLLHGQRDPRSSGVSFRISNKWLHDTLEAEVFGVVNLTARDWFVRPALTYALSDHWKTTIGGEFFGGDADTAYGMLKSIQGAFAEVRFGY